MDETVRGKTKIQQPIMHNSSKHENLRQTDSSCLVQRPAVSNTHKQVIPITLQRSLDV